MILHEEEGFPGRDAESVEKNPVNRLGPYTRYGIKVKFACP